MARKPFTPRPGGEVGSIAGRVVGVQRHGYTASGNPKMSVQIAITQIEGTPASSGVPVTMRISDNAMLVYAIENSEYREKVHEFDVTAAGRISGYTREVRS